jgi:DNA-binding PadR family transcriptional regulator
MDYDREFLTGTVGVLILSLLSERAMYGYEILQEAERRSAQQFRMKEGTVYPALHRLEAQGLITSSWSTESGRRRRVYRLTNQGRRVLAERRREWLQLSTAVEAVLG